jgi:hypothetical protein
MGRRVIYAPRTLYISLVVLYSRKYTGVRDIDFTARGADHLHLVQGLEELLVAEGQPQPALATQVPRNVTWAHECFSMRIYYSNNNYIWYPKNIFLELLGVRIARVGSQRRAQLLDLRKVQLPRAVRVIPGATSN